MAKLRAVTCGTGAEEIFICSDGAAICRNYINEWKTLMQAEQRDRLVLIRAPADAADMSPSEDARPPEFRLGAICSLEELEELWAIDREAYGEASITYDKFKEWWLSSPLG